MRETPGPFPPSQVGRGVGRGLWFSARETWMPPPPVLVAPGREEVTEWEASVPSSPPPSWRGAASGPLWKCVAQDPQDGPTSLQGASRGQSASHRAGIDRAPAACPAGRHRPDRPASQTKEPWDRPLPWPRRVRGAPVGAALQHPPLWRGPRLGSHAVAGPSTPSWAAAAAGLGLGGVHGGR